MEARAALPMAKVLLRKRRNVFALPFTTFISTRPARNVPVIAKGPLDWDLNCLR